MFHAAIVDSRLILCAVLRCEPPVAVGLRLGLACWTAFIFQLGWMHP